METTYIVGKIMRGIGRAKITQCPINILRIRVWGKNIPLVVQGFLLLPPVVRSVSP
jgi:hypothetical protein